MVLQIISNPINSIIYNRSLQRPLRLVSYTNYQIIHKNTRIRIFISYNLSHHTYYPKKSKIRGIQRIHHSTNSQKHNNREPLTKLNWITQMLVSREDAYTLKVPVTVSLADLTADSRSKPRPKSELSWVDCDDAYEFQSAKREDEGFCWSPLSVAGENHPCAVFCIFQFLISRYGSFRNATLLRLI